MTTFTARAARTPLSELWLLDAARRRDPRAEALLLARYEPLLRTTVRRCHRPTGLEAEDIDQEARVAFMRAVARWQPERGPFAAFARTTVRNYVLNALDAAGANKQRVLTLARPLHGTPGNAYVDGAGPVAADLRVPDPAAHGSGRIGDLVDRRSDADPEAVVFARHDLDALRAAMAQLTAWEKRALQAALNGQPRGEIARDHGVTVQAVRLAIRRARRKLAAHLEQQSTG